MGRSNWQRAGRAGIWQRAGRIGGWLLLLGVVLVAWWACAWCRYYGAIEGELRSSATNQPIAGAAIACVYQIQYGTIGGAVYRTAQACEASSDSDGHFRLPGRLLLGPHAPLSSFAEHPQLHVLAPGYEPVLISNGKAKLRLDPVTSPEKRRFAIDLYACNPGCHLPNFDRVYNAERVRCGRPEQHTWRE